MVSMIVCAFVYDVLCFGSGRDSRSVSRFGRFQTQYCKTVCVKEAKLAKSVTSTYVNFVKSATSTMVFAQWRRWVKGNSTQSLVVGRTASPRCH